MKLANWVSEPQIEMNPFKGDDDYLTPAAVKITEKSLTQNRNDFYKVYSVFTVTLLVALTAFNVLFTSKPNVVFTSSVLAVVVIVLGLSFGRAIQDDLFSEKAIKKVVDRLQKNIAAEGEPVKNWLATQNVAITDETVKEIVSTFWGLTDSAPKEIKGTVHESPTIEFKDVTGTEYALVAFDTHYRLVKVLP